MSLGTILVIILSTQQSCRARVAGEATSQLIGTLVLRLFAEFVLCADHPSSVA
jgi:hypothetical protein